MNCAVHTEVEASRYCRQCGKPLCMECTRDVSGMVYCEKCLAELVTRPQPQPGAGSPAMAALLGLVPGLGAVYNGEYLKALVHVMIFGGTIAMLSSGQASPFEPLLGMFLAAFYIYMPIDAYRTAQAKAQGRKPEMLPGEFGTQQPIGAIALIAVGGIFLLSNLGLFSIGRILQFWPVVLIILGIMMLRRRMQRESQEE
jgi:hypothetical protein